MGDLEPMVTFAAEHKELTTGQCARMIAVLAECIARRSR